MNLKKFMRDAQQEREDCGIGAVCISGRCVEEHLGVESLKEEEKERTNSQLLIMFPLHRKTQISFQF